MRRVVLAIVSTAAALVMLLSFKSHGVASPAAPPVAVSAASTGATSSTDGSSSTSSRQKKTTKSSNPTPSAVTVTGVAAATRYGPVQVQITVTNGKLTAVNAVEYPIADPRDAQINAYAIPALTQEALAAGSANIDLVSGATYTSDGYINSLQSALDKAGV
jgi:uncharacterized protein with FMN-binding domain